MATNQGVINFLPFSNKLYSLVCDICSGPVSREKGFVLTTEQVATSFNYWRYIFTQKLQVQLEDVDAAEIAALAIGVLSQGECWGVCEKCAVIFAFDRPSARALSLGWNPYKKAPKCKHPLHII